jgi:uncharacterized membrane protein
MKKKLTAADVLACLVMLIPLIYLGSIYSSLPASIPTHFNFHGPDQYSEKAESWVFVGILTGSSFFMYLLLKNLPSIDPKRTAASSSQLLSKLSFILVIFFVVLQLLIINAMRGNLFSVEKLLLPTISIFFSLMGNLMINMKPNYFVGIRVPWTLENEENWRKTHRLGGKLWFAGGLIAAVVTIILPYQYAAAAFMVIIGIMVIIPIGYSYLYFKKHQQD